MSKPTPLPATVDEALDFYWRDRSLRTIHIPDYAGFSEWVGDQMEKAKAASILPLHGSSVATPALEFLYELVSAISAAGVLLTASAVTLDPTKFGQPDGKRSRLKCLNRAKLLFALASNASPRTREMYMLFARPPEEWATARTVNRQSSQSDLRIGFFDAIQSRDAHLAFKLVGRLREESHDPGEVAFLEATASFHANRLNEAIDIVRSVPRDAADWPRAFMLLLEALALQGDIAGIEVEIGKADSHVDLPLFFLPYICQIAIENADSPEECFERALNVIDMDFDPLQPAPGVYQLWNRQSCKLAMRHVEQQQSLALRSQAIDQSELLAVTGELAISLDARRVSHALKLDPPLWESVTTAPLEDACAAILIRLMNSGEPGLPEYLQALLIQRRIGDLSAFVRNVVEGLENLRTLKSDQVWDLICSAYQEARVLRLRDEAERLRGALLGSPSIHLRLSKMEAASESDRIERQLSPMGRLALRAANWDLERASETPDSWRDAGMLCLGFFRILELEFNERLVVPMVGSLDLVGFEVRLSVLKAGSSNKREAKVLDFWDRLLGSLRKAHGQKKHLELGAMELLLRKIEQVAGVDSDLKALLRATAVMQLSQSGEEALASGRLAALIAEDKRETFRNPPAHARYVDLATAKDCKRYVEEALAKLLDWTRPRDGGRVVH